MAKDKNKTIVATIRERLRDYYFHWLWFKSVKIFGNHLHKTVRLSRTTDLDKAYPGGKNGADCYSKNGHAVTDLTRQS